MSGVQKNQFDEVETVEKERQVIELRRAGYTFDDIAKAVGYAYSSGAHQAFRRALKRTLIEAGIEELREQELDRLDRLQRSLWTQALTGDTKAALAILRFMEQRAKLLGLYAPTRISADVTTYEGGGDIDSEVRRLARILGNAENGGGEISMGVQRSETEPTSTD
jgi:hypothetical protein